jgi:hypothetical protein
MRSAAASCTARRSTIVSWSASMPSTVLSASRAIARPSPTASRASRRMAAQAVSVPRPRTRSRAARTVPSWSVPVCAASAASPSATRKTYHGLTVRDQDVSDIVTSVTFGGAYRVTAATKISGKFTVGHVSGGSDRSVVANFTGDAQQFTVNVRSGVLDPRPAVGHAGQRIPVAQPDGAVRPARGDQRQPPRRRVAELSVLIRETGPSLRVRSPPGYFLRPIGRRMLGFGRPGGSSSPWLASAHRFARIWTA